jgi:hypothetical protein
LYCFLASSALEILKEESVFADTRMQRNYILLFPMKQRRIAGDAQRNVIASQEFDW